MHKLPIEPHHHVTQIGSLRKRRALWEWWVVAMAISQVVGLGLVVGISAFVQASGTVEMVFLLHLMGLLEGVVLGVAQWLVLRRYIRHLGQWIAITAIAALFAWLVGLKASSLLLFFVGLHQTLTAEMQTQAMLKGIFLLGAWVGGFLGFAQWLVLKHHIRRAVWWVFANAFAWALGLVIAFLGTGLIHGAPLNLETALVGTATGLTMGAVVGAITGGALVGLLKWR